MKKGKNIKLSFKKAIDLLATYIPSNTEMMKMQLDFIFSKYPNIFIVSFDKKSFVKIEKNLNIGNNIYELQSTIIHKGIQYGGHYMSTIKLGDDWFIQDDDNLGKLNDFPKEDNHFILVYNLKTPSS